ncbi:ExbD/TolR family protein [Aestuariispira ectoiniformans]|uniref:ExbD/TolR family protein n=1 Tax=Aestuariispira ectoiniformans TaxID=2775080 RepID=UPI00223C495A|nr:biopolymer transporter ExbD [Aestuariispira ectoiniformans]
MNLSSRDEGTVVISLTPLVDVVFILLVFFMLASSFVEWRSIDAQTQAAQGRSNGLVGTVLADLKPDGDVVVGGRSMPPSMALQYIDDLHGDRPELKVLLRPADGVALQVAVDFAESLKAKGLADVSFKPMGVAQ